MSPSIGACQENLSAKATVSTYPFTLGALRKHVFLSVPRIPLSQTVVGWPMELVSRTMQEIKVLPACSIESGTGE